MTVRTRCWWVKFRECGELLHSRKFPLRLKGSVYRSFLKASRSVWKWTLKKQVEEESVKIGLRREDAHYRSKWSVGVYQISAGLR